MQKNWCYYPWQQVCFSTINTKLQNTITCCYKNCDQPELNDLFLLVAISKLGEPYKQSEALIELWPTWGWLGVVLHPMVLPML